VSGERRPVVGVVGDVAVASLREVGEQVLHFRLAEPAVPAGGADGADPAGRRPAGDGSSGATRQERGPPRPGEEQAFVAPGCGSVTCHGWDHGPRPLDVPAVHRDTSGPRGTRTVCPLSKGLVKDDTGQAVGRAPGVGRRAGRRLDPKTPAVHPPASPAWPPDWSRCTPRATARPDWPPSPPLLVLAGGAGAGRRAGRADRRAAVSSRWCSSGFARAFGRRPLGDPGPAAPRAGRAERARLRAIRPPNPQWR
jgi:hypothetical protein